MCAVCLVCLLRHSQEMILAEMSKNKYGADNLAFGSGGALLQKARLFHSKSESRTAQA